MLWALAVLVTGLVMAPSAVPVGASDLPPGTVTLEGELTGGALVQEWQDYISDFQVLWNRFDIRIYPLSDGTGQVIGSGVVRRSMIYTYVLEDRTDVYRYRDEVQVSVDGTWDATGRVTTTVVETAPAYLIRVEVIQGRQPMPTTEDRIFYGVFEGTWSAETGRLTGEIRIPELAASTLEAHAVATEPGVPESTTTSPPTLEEEYSRITVEPSDMECDPPQPVYVLMTRTPSRDPAWFQNPLNVSWPERIVQIVPPFSIVTVPDGFEVELADRFGFGYAKGPLVLRTPPCVREQTAAETVWDLLSGVGLFDWNAGQGELTIDTPHVIAGVMGTSFLVEVTDSQTTVVVLEGTVQVTGLTAGHQAAAAGEETTSNGSTVAPPQPTDPTDLAARYPWLNDALQALAQPPDLADLTGQTTPTAEESTTGSTFPLWPVVIAVALLALLGGGGLLWASHRRPHHAAPPAPPPSPPLPAPPPPPPPP
jgi:hypothetical protein